MGKGLRQKQASIKLKDFVIQKPARKTQSEVGNCVDSSERIVYPISAHDDTHRLSEKHIAYVAAVISTIEPKSFQQAMEDERWRTAVGSEYSALEDNKT